MYTALSNIDNERSVRHGPSRQLENPLERERRLEKWAEDNPKKNGLKKFVYGDNFVWALNQKNADKKAIKNNWISVK